MSTVARDDILPLAGDFPPADETQWRAQVEKVLKGADFTRRLVRRTYDGIDVQPLYTRGNAPAAGLAGLPGAVPFVRGATAAGTALGGWDIRQRHGHPDPATANTQILEDLERGVTSLQLRLDDALDGDGAPDGVMVHDAADLERTLAGVHVDLAPVGLDAGPRFAEAAALFLDLLERRRLDPAAVRADLNADPLGAALAGGGFDPEAALARAVELARHVAGTPWPGLTSLTADGRPYHAGGASEAQELACALATAVCYLRALTDAGLPAADAARQIGFSLAADADFFLTIAKLRALRRLWGRVLEVAGVAEAISGLRLHAETATRMLTRRDPYVNMLRATVATFAAAAGGATSITVLPFDHALGLPDAFARRIARNTQLVLLEESNLARVIDPAGGAWYVESLTDALAQRAWALAQEIERQGGMLAALRAGHPQGLIAATWAERMKNIATRREPVTGVSEFPDLREAPRHVEPPELGTLIAAARAKRAEAGTDGLDFAALLARARDGKQLGGPAAADSGVAPLPAHRLGEAFEALRDRSDVILARRGERPRVFLCNLGRLAEFTARATFAKNLFEAGGIEAVMSNPISSPEEIKPAFKASGARLAALCSSDDTYAVMAEAAARALKHAQCPKLYLMGNPGERRAAYEAAGIDEFVYLGQDVLKTLEHAHALIAGEAA